MHNDLIHCIYASRASSGFQEHEIPTILAKSRSNNAQSNITGMLLYMQGSFFQILEGDAQAVGKVFERIRRDSRHSRVTQIIYEPIARRSFSEWTMGFSTLALQDAGTLTGENDFFADATCITRLDRGRAKKLLNAFKNGSWRLDETGAFKTMSRSA